MGSDKSNSYRSVWSLLMATPFKQAFVEVNGIRTRYVEAGSQDAPPLLLLHGTGGHWEAFVANIAAFADHFRVLALDMMGCGFTDKPDRPYEVKDYADHVRAFMDITRVARAHLIGVSLGSWVCVRLAVDQPQRVERMILVAPTGYFPMPAQVQSALDARRAAADDPSWENTAKVLGKLFYDPSQVMDDLIAIRQRVYSLPGIDRIMPRMLTLFDPAIRARNNLTDDEWKRIQQPVLLVENVDTDDIFLKTARKIVTLLPNAHLVEMKRTSHWSQFESPDIFNRIALEFLSTAPERVSDAGLKT